MNEVSVDAKAPDGRHIVMWTNMELLDTVMKSLIDQGFEVFTIK